MLFAATVVLIVVVEVVEIYVDAIVPMPSSSRRILGEVDLLMFLGLPVLYVAAFRPLVRAMREQREAEEMLRRSERELAARSAVSELAVREEDSGRLLTRTMDHVVKVLGASGGWIFRSGDQSGQLPRVEGVRGVPPTLLEERSAELFLDSPACCGGLLDRMPPGETTLIMECRHLPREVLMAAGFGTYIGVTLPTSRAVRAILNLVWRDVREISDADRELLAAVARSVGIAAESAAMRDAEARARQATNTIADVSLKLNETLDLDEVLQILFENVGRFVPYDRGKVMLLEGESRLRVRAVFGPASADDAAGASVATFDAFRNPLVTRVLETRRVVYVADLHGHPEVSRQMQPSDEHSWLGVPLLAAGRVIGLMTLVKARPSSYSPDQLKLAEALCAPASVAIANARLYGEVNAGKSRLEDLSRKLVDVQELERRHLARELHDEIGQALTAILYRLEALKKVQPRPAGDILDETIAIADRTIHSVRNLSLDLRPALLDEAGLAETLRWYIGRQVRSDFLEVTLVVSPVLEDLPPAFRVACFRIVQEALTNVVRHAEARRATVHLRTSENRVEVEVSDDGRGFDLDDARGRGRVGRSLGILGMQERTELLGGAFTVDSSPGKGTTVRAALPVPGTAGDGGGA